jgi:hypothetical protein
MMAGPAEGPEVLESTIASAFDDWNDVVHLPKAPLDAPKLQWNPCAITECDKFSFLLDPMLVAVVME